MHAIDLPSLARRARGFAAAGILAGALLSGAGAPAAAAQSADIVDTAVASGQFTTLARALQAAGLVETLKTGGPFTVLAPTDAAFAKLPPGALDRLLANPAELTKVLTYHVIRGEVPASQVVGLTSATPIQGEPITISVSNGQVLLNGSSRVVLTDVEASNGIIHVIDTVLLPPSMTAAAPTPTPAPTPSPSPSAPPSQVARDRQSLATQTAATQTLFNSVWGGAAATEWVRQHEAELARQGR